MARLELTMPKMSMTMEEGTMVTWLKEPGDAVRSGEPVAEVTTDKVDMEVESPYDGVLAEQLAQTDDVVAVGAPIGIIESESDDLLGGLFDEEPAADAATPTADAQDVAEDGTRTADAQAAAPTAASSADGWPSAVPAARSLAASKGVDLSSVEGTGPWGAIRVSDVEAAGQQPAAAQAGAAQGGAPQAAATQAAAPMPSTASAGDGVQAAFDDVDAALRRLADVVAATPRGAAQASSAAASAPPTTPRRKPSSKRERLRQQVAKVMEGSATVPQFTAWVDLNLATADRVRKTELGGAGWTAILVRAHALALAETPALLGHWADDQAVDPDDGIGVALAIDGPDGLVAPVVRDPHRSTLEQVASQIADLVERTRSGSLTGDDLAGGTTVLSNLGGFGVRQFNALITPPHATALSTGAIEQRVVAAADGSFGVRLMCSVGLTVDHRVADGADAARALQQLQALVADPARLR